MDLWGPAGVELCGGAGPVDKEVCDGGFGGDVVIEHQPTYADLLQGLKVIGECKRESGHHFD